MRSHCPINFFLESFGDKWSLLILRDIIFRGKMTYGEFLKSKEGFATNILGSRLELLVNEGVLKKVVDPEDARRSKYQLSEKGIDIISIFFEILVWSEKYDPDSETRKAPRLLGLIKKDSQEIATKAKDRLRKGLPLFPEYLG